MAVLFLAAMVWLPQAAQALTPCYGNDAGTKYQVAPTDPGSWTAHASIDAAVTAGISAGRTVIEFQGTWTGIDETIKLRNSGLTFQGASGASMTWANNTDAFGNWDNLNFSTVISDVTLTVTGTGRGVAWRCNVSNQANTNSLTVANSRVTANADAIWVSGDGASGGNTRQRYTATVTNCWIVSKAGRGISILPTVSSGGGSTTLTNSLCVYDSRLETYSTGVDAYAQPTYVAAASCSVRIERSELICLNSNPTALAIGVRANPETLTTRVVEIIDTAVAGYGTGFLIRGGLRGTPAVVLANNTIVGTGSSTGIIFRAAVNWQDEGPMLVNNIIAGHTTGVYVASTGSGGSAYSLGDKNAYFANYTNRLVANTSSQQNDANRIEPGYTLVQAFKDPNNATLTNRSYRLIPSASALLNAGEQFTTAALGGTATYVDYNNNGTYQDGTDYLIDLGGATPSATTRMILVDAQVASPLPRLKGAKVDVGAYEAGPRNIAYNLPGFQELMPANNGSIDNTTAPMQLTFEWGTFAGTDGNEITNNVVVSNLPAGLTLSMIRANAGTNVNVTLLGNAAQHAAADSISNLGFAFQDAAFTDGSAATVGNATRSDLTITFFDPVSGGTLTYGGTNFLEDAVWNDGRIATTQNIYLASDQFNTPPGNDFVAAGWVVPSNIPVGLTAVVSRVNSTNVSVSFTGRTWPHAAADSANHLGLAFQNAAFLGDNAAVIEGANSTNLCITFLDPATNVQLLYGNTVFSEAAANDGSIATTIAITLTNDVFTGSDGDDFAAGASPKVVVSNLPNNLTAVVTRVDFKHLNATLTGKAAAHNSVHDAGNLTFAFQDSAFWNTAAAAVTNAARSDLALAFRNPVVAWGGSFIEAMPANDGSISAATVVRATLTGDTFAGANGSMAGKFTSANEPSGLSVVVTRTGDTNATVTLTGNAAAHANADDIANLTVAFGDTAFTMGGAAAVTNSSVSNLGVNFYDPSRTWYVSQLGTNGAPCDGSAAKPWATITYAIGLATVWDVIHVLPGTLTENSINVTKSLIIEGDGMDSSIVQAAPARRTAGNAVITGFGGDAVIRNLTLQHGYGVVSGSALYAPAINLRMEYCRIASNDTTIAAPWNGGAICMSSENGSGSLTLIGCEVKDNISGAGGGIYMAGSSAATLIVSNCTIRGNRGIFNGGGINAGVLRMYSSSLADNVSYVDGGGIVGGGNLYNSTISGNIASNYGGGLSFGGTMANCTVYGNTALATGHAYWHGGGGIFFGSPLTLRNCTIVSNTCDWYGGGINQDAATSSLDIESSIIAGNTAPVGPDHYRFNGAFSERYNLIGNNKDSPFVAGNTNVNGSIVGTAAANVDPMLDVLADNKGPTWTCALLPGSPAINAGSNPLGLLFDQRGTGFDRAAQGRADIGAFEYRTASGTVMMIR